MILKSSQLRFAHQTIDERIKEMKVKKEQIKELLKTEKTMRIRSGYLREIKSIDEVSHLNKILLSEIESELLYI